MLLLAHTGITLGAAVFVTGGLASIRHQVDSEDGKEASRAHIYRASSIII